jgi:NAD-dependent SIR2 family protein deacetylase
MPKTRTLNKLADDLAVAVQKHVRLKAADSMGFCQCVTCPKKKHWKEMQGGHFIERGKAHKTLEENIHPQCPYCNQYGMKRASVVLTYRRYMVDMYGEKFVTYLEESANDVVKRFRPDLVKEIKDLRARNRELEAGL